MSFTDHTAPSQAEAIAFEAELPHPPGRVWRALTDPVLLSQWLLPVTGFALVPGAAFSFRTDPQPGWDGVVHCRMLEADPPRRLQYSWGVPSLETVVTFTLVATASGTRLLLVQSGFKEGQKREFGGARYGWKMMGDRLAQVLTTIA